MTFSQIEVLRFLNECQIILEVNQAGLLILEWRDGIKAKVSLPLGLANLPRKMKNSVLKYSSFITNLFRFTRDKLFGLWDIELKGREKVCVCVWMCVCVCKSECVCVNGNVCLRVNVNVCVCVWMCLSVCECVYECVNVCVCVRERDMWFSIHLWACFFMNYEFFCDVGGSFSGRQTYIPMRERHGWRDRPS